MWDIVQLEDKKSPDIGTASKEDKEKKKSPLPSITSTTISMSEVMSPMVTAMQSFRKKSPIKAVPSLDTSDSTTTVSSRTVTTIESADSSDVEKVISEEYIIQDIPEVLVLDSTTNTPEKEEATIHINNENLFHSSSIRTISIGEQSARSDSIHEQQQVLRCWGFLINLTRCLRNSKTTTDNKAP
jgi:hypothetical protein